MKTIFRIAVLILLFQAGLAQSIPSRPSPPTLVNDFADILSNQEEQKLEEKLKQFEDSTSTQIAVISIQSLEGYRVEEVAHKFLRDWGVGQKEKNNGVVILFAIKDRKVNIQTGLGMEGVLPDMICKRIITKEIAPAFKKEQYFEGLDQATDAIISASIGEYTNDGKRGEDLSAWELILLLFVIIVLVSAMSWRSRSGGTILSRRGHTSWDGGGWWYLPRNGGGSSSGGGGSGFGGFGGGDGGGGGASGDW